jgi:hypothetical protein
MKGRPEGVSFRLAEQVEGGRGAEAGAAARARQGAAATGRRQGQRVGAKGEGLEEREREGERGDIFSKSALNLQKGGDNTPSRNIYSMQTIQYFASDRLESESESESTSTVLLRIFAVLRHPMHTPDLRRTQASKKLKRNVYSLNGVFG